MQKSYWYFFGFILAVLVVAVVKSLLISLLIKVPLYIALGFTGFYLGVRGMQEETKQDPLRGKSPSSLMYESIDDYVRASRGLPRTPWEAEERERERKEGNGKQTDPDTQ